MNRLTVLLVLALASSSLAEAPALSDAATVARPAEGEYFGLYLMGKKVGYLFTKISVTGDKLTSVNEIHFKAHVDKQVSERMMKETHVYEAKPNGKLLTFSFEKKGDGGDEILEGTSTPTGLRVLRKRPGIPNETLSLKASKEVVEDADQARVALKRNKKLEGMITDGTDLEQYKVVTTVGPTEQRTVRGVSVKLRQASTLSDKEKVPTDVWVDEAGRMVEIHFGPTMTALLEAEDVAKRLDVVEVFGLTRVVLPKPIPPTGQTVPGEVKMIMLGLPEKFRTNTYRQKFKALEQGRVEVTISANPPKARSVRPLADPNGGANLKSTIVVEAENPEIKATARKIIGNEKDAYAAAKLITKWVFNNVNSDYGASSDRATDVLKTMKGDCTEHSLLAVALMRAVGIPAKRVDGLVYLVQSDKTPALYWHEWVEAYVGEWTQLDPTFDEDVVKPTHFAVGEEGNAEITPLIGALQVIDVR